MKQSVLQVMKKCMPDRLKNISFKFKEWVQTKKVIEILKQNESLPEALKTRCHLIDSYFLFKKNQIYVPTENERTVRHLDPYWIRKNQLAEEIFQTLNNINPNLLQVYMYTPISTEKEKIFQELEALLSSQGTQVDEVPYSQDMGWFREIKDWAYPKTNSK